MGKVHQERVAGEAPGPTPNRAPTGPWPPGPELLPPVQPEGPRYPQDPRPAQARSGPTLKIPSSHALLGCCPSDRTQREFIRHQPIRAQLWLFDLKSRRVFPDCSPRDPTLTCVWGGPSPSGPERHRATPLVRAPRGLCQPGAGRAGAETAAPRAVALFRVGGRHSRPSRAHSSSCRRHGEAWTPHLAAL